MKALATRLKEFTAQELRDMYQDFNIKDEEFVPMFFRGQKTDYTISKYGNVIGKRGHKLKWTIKNTAGRPEASVSVYPPADTNFTDEGFEYGAKNKVVTLYVHRLVALHFLPFPEYLPEQLRDDWNKVSDNTKNLIRDSLQVDHLDGNTYNPRWDNLEWVTVKENARRVVRKEK